MALRNKCSSKKKRGNEEYGMGLVRSTSFGRKRVALSKEFRDDNYCMPTTPSKKQSFEDSFSCTEKKCSLEDLPQEILIRVLCGVEHDDLKRLFFVSKAIREVTLIAKQSYFAYNTPRKAISFRKVDDFGGFDDVKTPNAPKVSRVPRARLSAKKLADVSVNLFASGIVEGWV